MRIFAFSVCLVVLFAGCSIDNTTPSLMESGPTDQELFSALYDDPAFQDNQDIVISILEAYSARGITSEDIRKHYNNNDITSAANMLGITVDDINYLSNRMKENITLLKSRHDFLNDENFMNSCTVSSTSESVIDNIDHAVQNYNSGYDPFSLTKETQSPLSKSMKRPESKKKALGACLVATGIGCALTGPWAIITCPLGAYVCVCGFCEGGWVDSICD